MAEALLNRFGNGRFRGFGADFEPAAEIHPLTLEILQAGGLATAHLKPRNVREFMGPEAPRMDFVINLVPKSVLAALRGFPGSPMIAKWGISDPNVPEGDTAAQRLAFRRAFREIENRIRLFVLVRHSRESAPGMEASRQAQNA